MRIFLAAIFFLFFPVIHGSAQAVNKEDSVSKKSSEISLDIPDLDVPPVYHALLIAEDRYDDNSYTPLPGSLGDIRKIYTLLVTAYNFEPANVQILVNASKATILSKLNAKVKGLNENDNLFLFYSGHGWVKKNAETGRREGYLVPSDASRGNEVSFINNYDIVSILNRCVARHILVAVDAPFSGGLFREISSDAPQSVKDAYREKSRRLLTTGNEQESAGKSLFVDLFRSALQENREKYITAGKLINGFKDAYMERTLKIIQYNPIPNVDDQGGEFVFIRR
ncbi:MAG: caspase family protein [Chitinophagaceae bacterium]|nr:caspase family protein [Chitinophagaceae bacterium]MBL0055148.1 caspase family protein [Chitinophagaceae bacterium]